MEITKQYLYKTGFFCGRLQHVHLGHTQIIDEALKHCEQLLILVGSSQESGTVRNPFSAATRIKMLRAVYADNDRVIIVPLKDMTTEDDINHDWGRYVLAVVKEYLGDNIEAMFYGNDEDRAGWFDPQDVENIVQVVFKRDKLKISATELRQALALQSYGKWALYTPVQIHPYFNELRKELLNIKHYQSLLEEKGTWQVPLTFQLTKGEDKVKDSYKPQPMEFQGHDVVGYVGNREGRVYSDVTVRLRPENARTSEEGVFERELIVKAPCVVVVTVHAETGAYILTEEFRAGSGKTSYGFVAGMVDGDELPIQAAIRELKEETGYTAIGIKQMGEAVYSSPGFTTEKSFFFLAMVKGEPETQTLDPDEKVAVQTGSKAFVGELIDTGVIDSAQAIVAWTRHLRYLH